MADQNRFEGVGHGPHRESLHAAIDDAWQKAKAAGKHDKELRVVEWYVSGENPINMTRVVLSADG